ncbi:MAG: VOC family protein, partial [Candidatus Thorarchaeota archaeon]
EKFKINFSQLKVDQLGFVFKDIEKQAKVMEEIYGIPPFTFFPAVEFPTKYRGNDAQLKARAAFSQLGDTQVELIEWKEGESPYKDFLDQEREGLHHIGIYVEDLDPYISEFERHGIEILFYGEIGGGKFAYMDTEQSFGIIAEIIQRP